MRSDRRGRYIAAVKPRILIIKLSAFGDFVQALGAMAAIRRHHAEAHLVLLTTASLEDLARGCGLFDEIWIDPRAPLVRPDRWLPLVRRLRNGGFARIYDLQWADRTACYFRGLKRPRPEWVGVVEGCSHRFPDRSARQHIRARHAALLRLAGIESVPPPDLSFLTADTARYGIQGPYALLVPGSSPQHRDKRWPAERYAAVAEALAAEGLASVLIVGDAERAEAETIAAACPCVYDVDSNREEIVALARGACLAVSNDTGPSFLIAAAGCPTVLVYGERSDPVKLAPPDDAVTVLRGKTVDDIAVEEVLEAAHDLIHRFPRDGMPA